MNRAIPCPPSFTLRPSKWPVTPEVAGSSPVAPVSPFALQTPFSVVCIGARGAIAGSKTGSNLAIEARAEIPPKRGFAQHSALRHARVSWLDVVPDNVTSGVVGLSRRRPRSVHGRFEGDRVVDQIRWMRPRYRPACDQRTGCNPSVLVVEHRDVRDADDRALRRLQPGNRLTSRLLTRWMQQLVSGLLEFLCCRTHGRGRPQRRIRC
jgi:hypothetical protein